MIGQGGPAALGRKVFTNIWAWGSLLLLSFPALALAVPWVFLCRLRGMGTARGAREGIRLYGRV